MGLNGISKGLFFLLLFSLFISESNKTLGQCLSVNIGVIVDQNADACNGPITLDAHYPGYNHSWNTGELTQKIIVTHSDTFIVVVDDGMGCSGTDTITVTFLDSPTIDLGPDPSPQCGGCVYLDAGGDPGLSYQWSTGETTKNIRYCQAGTNEVSVKVTNSVGCSVSDTVNVTISPGIAVDLGPDVTTCDTSVQLTTNLSGYNYLWSTGETTDPIYVNQTDTFYVDVNDGSGCVGSDTILVKFLPIPTVDLGSDPASQCGGCVNLDAGNTAGYSYDWSTGESQHNIRYCQTGINEVSVKVTNGNGCSDRDTIMVNILPGYDASLGNDITVCGGTVTLSAPVFSDASYLWNTGATTSSIDVATAGDYDVTIFDLSGCSSQDTLSDIIHVSYDTPLPASVEISDNSSCKEKKYSATLVSGATSYTWTVPAGCSITGGQGTPSITMTANGNITGTISVVAENGIPSCSSVEKSLPVNIGDHPLNIPSAFTPNNDGLNDTWVMRNIELYPDNEIFVLNRWGNEVYHAKNYRNSWDGSGLNEGTYFYKIIVRFCDEEKTISDYVTIVR